MSSVVVELTTVELATVVVVVVVVELCTLATVLGITVVASVTTILRLRFEADETSLFFSASVALILLPRASDTALSGQDGLGVVVVVVVDVEVGCSRRLVVRIFVDLLALTWLMLRSTLFISSSRIARSFFGEGLAGELSLPIPVFFFQKI